MVAILGNLDLLLWYLIFPLIGFLTVVLSPILLPLIWFKLIPEPARTLISAKRKRRVKGIYIDVSDSGQMRMEYFIKYLGEGVFKTNRGLYKILPRRASANPHGDPYIHELTLKRTYLRDMNLPVYIGYSGRITAMTPDGLALIEASKFTPKKFKGNRPKPTMLLDPREIKEVINKNYSQSQIAAIVKDSELIGLAERGYGRFMIPIAVIIIIMIMLIVAMQMFPNMFGAA